MRNAQRDCELKDRERENEKKIEEKSQLFTLQVTRIVHSNFHIPSVWAKRKVWDQNGGTLISKTTAPHSMKI